MASEDRMKGSLLRCLMLTSLPPVRFAEAMENLVGLPEVKVDPTAFYMPHGAIDNTEAQLHTAPIFLTDKQKLAVKQWWLADYSRNPTTPNWDIVCQCQISGRPGLILVEAKAHKGELTKPNSCQAKSPNKDSIAGAISNASKQLADTGNYGKQEWCLHPSKYYQLSNRFAWCWKLATFEIPVVLVYLGFLNATEMANEDTDLLSNHSGWHKAVSKYSPNKVPVGVWDNVEPMMISNSPRSRIKTPFWALIRSMEMGYKAYSGSGE